MYVGLAKLALVIPGTSSLKEKRSVVQKLKSRTVNRMPGTDGLVHISELAEERTRKVTDVCDEGDELVVKVINVDRDGKIRLSRKEALKEENPEILDLIG